MSDNQNTISRVKGENNAPSESGDTEPAISEDVDMSVLLDFEEAQCEGEPDFIVELIDLYLADAPLQLSAIKESVLKADPVSLKRAAHTFKGSSANLGVNGIAALCEELEKTDSSASFPQLSVLINRMEETFARVRSIFLAERQGRI